LTARDPKLADQLRRAAQSVSLNLAEVASGKPGRRKHELRSGCESPQRNPPGNQSRRRSAAGVSESCVGSRRLDLRSVDSEPAGRAIQPRKKEMGGRCSLQCSRQYGACISPARVAPRGRKSTASSNGIPRNLRDLCVSSSNNGRHPVDGARPRSQHLAIDGTNRRCKRGSAERRRRSEAR
jgi:hypothetical protein